MEGGFPLSCRGRGSLVFGAGEGSGRLEAGSWGGRLGCCWGQELWDPRLWHRGSGGPLVPIGAAATSLSSQCRWHLTIFPTHLPILFQTLHVCCCQICLLQHITPGGKKKLWVNCWHSVVSKYSQYKKVFIYICPFRSVLFNNSCGLGWAGH